MKKEKYYCKEHKTEMWKSTSGMKFCRYICLTQGCEYVLTTEGVEPDLTKLEQ